MHSIVFGLSVTIAHSFDLMLTFVEALAKTDSKRLTKKSAV